MRLTTILICLAALVLPQGEGQAAAQRVVSINLCADQYLLALASPDQIAAVSRLARDPNLSFLAEEASRIPTVIGTAEEVVSLDPDLVLTGAFTHRTTASLLDRFGYDVVSVPYAQSIEDVRAGLLTVAEAIGQTEAGLDLVRALDSAVASDNEGTNALSIVHYQSRGFVTGSQTLLGEMLALAGFENLADDLGISSLGRVPLEHIVVEGPDRLLAGSPDGRSPGLGQTLPLHPVLDRVLPPNGRLPMPGGLISCGGPATVEAISYLRSHALNTDGD